MKLAKGDAHRLQKGQLEGDIVGDDAHAIEQGEDVSAGLVQVDNQDASAASVDLKKPDAGAVRVEARRLGVPDFNRETLPCGGERRDLGGRGFELLEPFERACRFSARPKQVGEAIHLRLVWRSLDVDGDPTSGDHLREEPARLGLLGAINDPRAGERVGCI